MATKLLTIDMCWDCTYSEWSEHEQKTFCKAFCEQGSGIRWLGDQCTIPDWCPLPDVERKEDAGDV